MAEAVGFAILSAVAIEATATTAAVVGTIAITAATVGASYLLQQSTQTQPKREAQQATLNQAMGARRRIYGKALVGGTRAFWEARHGELHQAIILASHEIDGIENYMVGDMRVTTDGGEAGGNVLDFPMTNKIFFERYLGSAGQAAATMGLTRFPDVWTADHRLAGLAYVWVVFGGTRKEDTSKVFPQGAGTVLRFAVRGAKIWDVSVGGQDPENPATWAWGENPADCILDYLRHQDGMRQPLSRIDAPSFVDMHALCAETVSRKDGSTEARYRLWGAYEFSEEPKDILARMCATCDATLYQGASGQIGIRGGKWVGPLVNIATDGIVTASLTQGNDKLDAYNRLKVSYTDPDAFYQPTELQARDDLASQAAIGVIDAQRDLVMVPSFSQAARLAKIAMAKDNPIWKGTLGTHLAAIDALGETTVQFTYDPVPGGVEPLMNAPGEITAFSLRGDASGCDIGFRSVPASAYDWNPATEEPPRPVVPATIAQINEIDDPTGVALGVDRPLVSGDLAGVRLYLTWDGATREDAEPEAQYAAAGSDAWSPMSVSDDELGAYSPLISDGGSYEARVRFVVGGTASDWVDAGPVDAISDPVVTLPPTGLVANGAAGQVMLAWTAPNSANVRSARVYRATSGAPFSSATIVATINLSPNQAFDMTDSGLSAGSYDYWVRALNRGGVGDATSTTGPVTATVT